jgi:CHASE3 domain sensor protein
MRLSPAAKLSAGVSLVAVTMAFAICLCLRALNAQIASRAQVLHSYKVLNLLKSTLSSLKDAETGQRGFIITGDEDYLEPYNRGSNTVNKQIDELKDLTKDNADQQVNIGALSQKVNEKLSELALCVKARRERGFDAAKQIVTTNQGKIEMDEARRIIKSMIDVEERLLTARTSSLQRDTNSNLLSSLGFGVFSSDAFLGCS